MRTPPVSRTTIFILLGALVAAPGAAIAQASDRDAEAEARALEERDRAQEAPPNLDLDERIAPVSGRTFVKDGRHEISPTAGISLGDAFFTKYLLGLRYAYHLTETWSLGLTGAYAVDSSPSGAVNRCDSNGQNCGAPTSEDLRRAPGDLGFMGSFDVSWAPLYGKISLLAEQVLHFDTYVLAGAGVVQSKMAPQGSVDVESKMLPALQFGVGQRYFVSRHATLRFEIRDVIYQTDAVGQPGEKDIQNQLLFTIGISFLLGDGPEH